FFIAACDYVLIGEELFAASAYLSKDLLDKITLRTQDVSKALVMLSIATGSLISIGEIFIKVSNIPLINVIYKIFSGMVIK
ncbi:MAG: DUF6754 domain-containing protein, partial [bacterium]